MQLLKINYLQYIHFESFSPLLYVVVAVLLYPLWIYTSWPSVIGSPTKALFLFGFSAWLESFADPFVVICQRSSLNVEFAILQCIQIISQRIFVLILITATKFSHIWIFCYAQVCYYWFVFIIFYLKSNWSVIICSLFIRFIFVSLGSGEFF